MLTIDASDERRRRGRKNWGESTTLTGNGWGSWWSSHRRAFFVGECTHGKHGFVMAVVCSLYMGQHNFTNHAFRHTLLSFLHISFSQIVLFKWWLCVQCSLIVRHNSYINSQSEKRVVIVFVVCGVRKLSQISLETFTDNFYKYMDTKQGVLLKFCCLPEFQLLGMQLQGTSWQFIVARCNG